MEAGTFLYALKASDFQVRDVLNLDEERLSDLKGRMRERSSSSAGLPVSLTSPARWAKSLQRQDARMLLQELTGVPSRQIAENAFIKAWEVDDRLDRIYQTAPKRLFGPEKSFGAQAGEKRRTSPLETPAGSPRRSEAASASYAAANAAPTVPEWLEGLTRTARLLLTSHFQGDGIAASAKQLKLSVSEARRIRDLALEDRPALAEDRYEYLYKTYRMNPNEFAEATGLGTLSLGYLRSRFPNSGLKPIGFAADDPKVPSDVRERIGRKAPNASAAVLSAGKSPVTTVRPASGKPRTRSDALRAYGAAQVAERGIPLGDFLAGDQEYLRDNGLDAAGMRLPAAQAALPKLDATGKFLAASQKCVRYYDFSAHDFKELVSVVRRECSRNIECSAQLLVDEHPRLMESLSIGDGHELYSVLKHIGYGARLNELDFGPAPYLKLGRMASRKEQLVRLLREMTPCSLDDFAAEYRRRYGVEEITAKRFARDQLTSYYRNGRLEISSKRLGEEQLDYLRGELKTDCCPLEPLKSSYAAAFSGVSPLDVNDEALAALGYKISGSLVFREGLDPRRYFDALIDSHENFKRSDAGFEDAVFSHPAFRNALNARLQFMDYVEYDRDLYLSAAALARNCGITRGDLSDYADRILSHVGEEPFSVPGLLKAGFRTHLDDVCDEEAIDVTLRETLLASLPAGRGLKRTNLGGVRVFCKSDRPFSTADLLAYVARREGHIDLYDLVDLLSDDFGVELGENGESTLRGAIESAMASGIAFYDPGQSMLFPSKEARAAYLLQCLKAERNGK